jgi:hypothetical protein
MTIRKSATAIKEFLQLQAELVDDQTQFAITLVATEDETGTNLALRGTGLGLEENGPEALTQSLIRVLRTAPIEVVTQCLELLEEEFGFNRDTGHDH